MVKKLILLGLVASFISTAGLAHAQDVFRTKRGKKYHKEICRMIKNKDALIKIDKQEAVVSGLAPCGKCFKEDLADEKEGNNE